MGGVSIWHWLIMLVSIAIFTVPCARILRRVGLSGWWALLTLVPLVNIVALWVFAFVPWPENRNGLGPNGPRA